MTGFHNSHIETILGLCLEMLFDLSVSLTSVWESLRVAHPDQPSHNVTSSLSKDGSVLTNRVRCEGIQYLTITLPRLGKWLDSMLNGGVILPYPQGFSPYEKGKYPLFLQTFWKLLFIYINDPNPDPEFEERFLFALKQVRTFLYCFYKLEVPCDPLLEDIALKSFVQNDLDCEVPWSALAQEVTTGAAAILARCLEVYNPFEQRHVSFDPYDIRPKHGPGAVATGEKQEEKWTFRHFFSSLHQQFPYYKYMYGTKENGRAIQLADEVRQYRSMVKDKDPTSKVVLVPKDSRGPRVICSEPLEIQFIQQGVASRLVHFIEHHPDTAGHVNFTLQSVNANLARTSSLTREFATLDMKDASDLVSLELFRAVWPEELQPAFLAARSSHAQLPNGEVIRLKKYAPMGSALCFPVESMIFYAICVCALMKNQGVPFDVARQRVYVYGDDIIVPTEAATAVIKALESVGLKVNHSKCCFESSFRESCGVDAYKGVDITPQRIRKLPGRRPSDGVAFIAWSAYAGHFYSAGMRCSSKYIRKVVTDVLGNIPITSSRQGFLSFVIPDLEWCLDDYPPSELDSDMQHFRAKLWVVSDKKRALALESWKRLNRDLLDPPQHCLPNEVVVPNATKITKRKVGYYAPVRNCDL